MKKLLEVLSPTCFLYLSSKAYKGYDLGEGLHSSSIRVPGQLRTIYQLRLSGTGLGMQDADKPPRGLNKGQGRLLLNMVVEESTMLRQSS